MSDRQSQSENTGRQAIGVPDSLLGLLFVIGGVVIFLTGRSMEGIGGMAIGPGTMPMIIGVAVASLGAVLTVQGLAEISALRAGRAVLLRWRDWSWFPFIVLAALLAYIVLFRVVGFPLLTFVFVLAMIVAGGGGALRGAVHAGVIVAVIYVVFSDLLRVPLPLGLLG